MDAMEDQAIFDVADTAWANQEKIEMAGQHEILLLRCCHPRLSQP